MVSIIVPCFNGSKYIKRCLNSIINQSYKNIEVIIVNDGSTDDSDLIISKYLDDDRIKYYKQSNKGIGKTRNFGISKASGDYITFLDIDDYFACDAIEKMISFSSENDLDVVVSDYYIKNKDTKEFKINDFEITSTLENPDILLDINFAPWGKLYKKDLIEGVSFEEKLKYEDAPFVIKSLLKAKRVGKLNYPTVYYTVNNGSETSVRDSKVFDIIKIIDIIRKELIKNNLDEISRKLIVKTLTNHTIQQRYNQDKDSGMKFIDEAFSYMKEYVPDYKRNIYYIDRGFLRRTIEKNKLLTKIYVELYRIFK